MITASRERNVEVAAAEDTNTSVSARSVERIYKKFLRENREKALLTLSPVGAPTRCRQPSTSSFLGELDDVAVESLNNSLSSMHHGELFRLACLSSRCPVKSNQASERLDLTVWNRKRPRETDGSSKFPKCVEKHQGILLVSFIWSVLTVIAVRRRVQR